MEDEDTFDVAAAYRRQLVMETRILHEHLFGGFSRNADNMQSLAAGLQGLSGEVEAERSDLRCKDWLQSEKDNVDDVVCFAGPGCELWQS